MAPCCHTIGLIPMRPEVVATPLLMVLMAHGATAMHVLRYGATSFRPALPSLPASTAMQPTMSAACASDGNDGGGDGGGDKGSLVNELESVTSNAGISERERKRFEYLIKTHEPIPQEIIGLQAIFGCIGSQYAGFCGFIIGALQLAPFFSMIPGRSGNVLRGSGWHVFWMVRVAWVRVALVFSAIAKHLRSWLRETRRWDDATGVSATASRAVRSCGADLRRGATRRDLLRTLRSQLQLTRFVPHQRPRGPSISDAAGPGRESP